MYYVTQEGALRPLNLSTKVLYTVQRSWNYFLKAVPGRILRSLVCNGIRGTIEPLALVIKESKV